MQPTLNQVRSWFSEKRWEILSNFDKVKQAEVLTTLLGTEVEAEAQVWDECVDKLEPLLEKVYPNQLHYRFGYNKGQYLKKMVEHKVDELYGTEKEQLQDELKKIINKLHTLRSVPKMLDYLKTCEIPYPAEEAEKVEAEATINIPMYKPYVQLQLTQGEADENA